MLRSSTSCPNKYYRLEILWQPLSESWIIAMCLVSSHFSLPHDLLYIPADHRAAFLPSSSTPTLKKYFSEVAKWNYITLCCRRTWNEPCTLGSYKVFDINDQSSAKSWVDLNMIYETAWGSLIKSKNPPNLNNTLYIIWVSDTVMPSFWSSYKYTSFFSYMCVYVYIVYMYYIIFPLQHHSHMLTLWHAW